MGISLRQKLTLITLGVKNLDKAVHFYEEGLGWKRSPASQENLTLFNLGGFALALYPRVLLAKDASVKDEPTGFSGITLSYNAENEKEVDAVMKEVEKLGAKIVKRPQKAFWGGYSGYFKDLDDHLIEVAFNPFWKLDKNGNLTLP